MNVDYEFGTLSLNNSGAKYYIDAQCIYFPFAKDQMKESSNHPIKIHELVHFYQSLSTSFGLYQSILYTLRSIIIKGYLREMSRSFSQSIWLPIMQWRNDDFGVSRSPISKMITLIRMIDAAISAFDPWFFLKDKSESDKFFKILSSNYRDYFPFGKYLIAAKEANWLYPAPQAYTDNYSILEGLALYREIEARADLVSSDFHKEFLNEVKEISSQSKQSKSSFSDAFGTSMYTRSFEIAAEYLNSDTFTLFPFMCELALFGELPHIKGWPPLTNFGRCGKGGTVAYEKVNPGSRYEDIFFFFSSKTWQLKEYISAFTEKDTEKVSCIVDEICEFCQWKHPQKIVDEELVMVDLLLDQLTSTSDEIQLEYISLIDLLKCARELLLLRKNNLFFLTFQTELPTHPLPFIFFADGPESFGIDYDSCLSRMVDSTITKMLFPYFEHSAVERNDMQVKYNCPSITEESLAFLCSVNKCNGFSGDCWFRNFLSNSWRIGENPIQILL